MPYLEIQNVSKYFGGVRAVDNLSLTVDSGDLAGIIGPNGAGKSTLFNLISGFDKPTSGDIRINGQSTLGIKPHEIARLGIGRTFQAVHLFSGLTVHDTLTTALYTRTPYSIPEALFRTRRFKESERIARQQALQLLDLVGLAAWKDSMGESLPYGLQRKLELAKALALEPKLLLLDEPAAGLNTDESIDLSILIERIWREFGVTVLLIEHRMEVVMRICRRITVLNFGQKVAEGTSEQIRNDPRVLEAYLGKEGEDVA
ncbi:MAG: ABC transporter ATP-binding protein [Bacillota bacterium]|jgi:branched-chain amino acid transport system ATP-binding protein|nr:ABC transporter ATP-binding protein [Bacillota bacterium]